LNYRDFRKQTYPNLFCSKKQGMLYLSQTKNFEMVQKTITTVTLALVGMLVVFSISHAQYGLDETAGRSGYDTSYANSEARAEVVIGDVVAAALALVAFLFFAMMIYAGLRWMTARGNDELVEKARNALQAAIIGFVIVSLSYGLTIFIFKGLANFSAIEGPVDTCAPLQKPACAADNNCGWVGFVSATALGGGVCVPNEQVGACKAAIDVCTEECNKDLSKAHTCITSKCISDKISACN
jgi:hypothetical protein